MLTDIFSSFDPNMSHWTFFFPPSVWLLLVLTSLLTYTSFWVSPTRTFWTTSLMLSTMSQQVRRTTGLHLKGFNSVLSSLFISLIFSNLLGLIPYAFSTTSHLLLTLSFALPLWLMLIISALVVAPGSVIAHLLPANTPSWLCPPLVLIETVSTVVRPITLSFRLAANMSAGHIVLSLIGIYSSSTIFSFLPLSTSLMMLQTTYLMFETGICLIQAYIFCLLLSLYVDEHPTLQ